MHDKSHHLRVIEEEIMETLFDLSIRDPLDRIKMKDILNRLGEILTKAQLTNIVRRKLESEDYVDYVPYEGIILKPKGFEVARKIARNHRLAEAMLYNFFDVPFDKLHDLACQLEHAITDETAEYIKEKLLQLNIRTTPFGMPIPMDNLDDLGCDDEELISIPPGTHVTLTRIQTHTSDTAASLMALNIHKMGIKLLIKTIKEEGVLVENQGSQFLIPHRISKNLCVKRSS